MTNDWIVANLNNPDFSVSDFQNIADMSVSNTQMLTKDEYLKSDYIKNNDAFKDSQGKFSQKAFDKFYNQQLQTFQQFRTNNTTDGLSYDVFDIRRTPDSKIKQDKLTITKSLNNPDKQKIGIEGVNVWSDPELSKSEIAQTQQIYNYETGKFEDYTPHDQALFNGKTDFGLSWIKSLFDDPLVLATYDSDGVDKYGNKHYKGQYKLNENGTYYYETLGDRSPVGKEVLSSLDNLTVEGTTLNKYDFFDSDDIEKSVTGTVAKNVTSLIPIFIGGPVGTAYSTLIIAKEMAKSLPMLYNMATALFGNEDAPAWMNRVAAMGDKFTSGSSQYAKENTFAFENFGNLVADVALQWGQQKTVANAINKMRGSQNLVEDAYKNAEALYLAKAIQPEWMAQAGNPAQWMDSALGKACIKKFVPQAEKAMVAQTALGRDASLAYMAIISNSDVYGDAIQHGATKQEAASIALGSTLGMFAVDKYAHLGEIFFDDATEDSVKAARKAIKNELVGEGNIRDTLTKGIINNPEVEQNAAKKYLSIINNSASKIKNLFNNFNEDLKYHTLGFFGKAAGEGTEEVAEELVTDTAKSIYELAGFLGANTSSKDVGAWDNALERYTMSFAGGAVGGGIFYAKEALDNPNMRANKHDQEMAVLIRNGHAQELRNEVEKLRKKGKLGSTNLSGTKYDSVKDDAGNITSRTWLTASNADDTQNELIAKHINNKINAIEAIINNNELGLSDEQLFNNMVLQESRYQAYKEIAPITNYYDEFQSIFSEIADAQTAYNKASNSVDGTENGDPVPTDNYLHGLTPEQQKTREENIQKYEQRLQEARARKDEFLSGKTSIDYIRKLNFAIDPSLYGQFVNANTEALWKSKFPNKEKKDATPQEIKEFNEAVAAQQRFTKKEQITQAWNRFKAIENTLKPQLHLLSENASEYKDAYTQFQTIINDLNSLKLEGKNWNDKLDSETDDEFKSRDAKLKINDIEETDDEFIARRNKRASQLNAYNLEQRKKYVDSIESLLQKIDYKLDPITQGQLLKAIPMRVKDVINITAAQNPAISDKLKLLNFDLSNAEEVENYVINDKINKQLALVQDAILELNSIANKEELDGFNSFNNFSEQEDTTWSLNDLFKEDTEGNNIGIDTYIQWLNERMSEYPNDISEATRDKYLNEIKEQLTNFVNNFTGDLTKVGDMNIWDAIVGNNLRNALLQDIDSSVEVIAYKQALANISNDPLFKLQNDLKTKIKNPFFDLVASLADKVFDGKKLGDIKKLLDILNNKWLTIDSIEDLTLDEEQLKVLHTVRDSLQLIDTYLYAMAAESQSGIGHNKMINEFAEKHKDLILDFEALPELDMNYLSLYINSSKDIAHAINTWIDINNTNAVNKKRQFIKTDEAFTKSYVEFWNKFNKQITINGQRYNLLEGVQPNENQAISLYNYERAFNTNLNKIIKDTGLSIKEILDATGLLDNILKYDTLSDQSMTRLSPNMKYNDLTSYDKLVYLATIASLNSAEFYSFIKKKVGSNQNIAPITTQEYASRISIASMNKLFKDIIGYAYDKGGHSMPNVKNTVIINGDAGTGKTSVVVSNIVDFYNSNVMCVGPTDQQAINLKMSLNRGTTTTIEALMHKLLGDDFTKVKEALNTKSNENDTKLITDNTYFSIQNQHGDIQVILNKDAFKFNKLDEDLIIIDEATHLSALYAQILDLYAQQNNKHIILMGDQKQRGYTNQNNFTTNIGENDFFAVRTPELNVSLRDNNIQKQNNLAQVISLLGPMLDNFKSKSTNELKAYWKSILPLIQKIQFKCYDKDSLAGDFIVNTLSDSIINKLKGSTDIGFIGDTSSAAYQQLVKAGITPKVRSIAEMQGSEFDYVIIDQKLRLEEGAGALFFMQDLYTLMSRGKTASIFIDNGLSKIIKAPVNDEYTAKAPSLTDKINGKSAIDALKEAKLALLNQLDLTFTESTVKPTSQEDTGESSTEDTLNPMDFHNPDERKLSTEEATRDEKVTTSESVKENEDVMSGTVSDSFELQCYGAQTFLSVETEKAERIKNGHKYKQDLWKIAHGKERRNLQALSDQDELFWYNEKIEAQKLLKQVRDMLLYGYNIDDVDPYNNSSNIIPQAIRNKFSKHWSEGVYKIEIREANDVLPIGSDLKNIGLKYEGKSYIVSLIYEVSDNDDNICKFDIAGLNDPETLSKSLSTIKDNLEAKIAKDPSRQAEYQKRIDNLNNDSSEYDNLFKGWINEYNKKGKFEQEVPNELLIRYKTTVLKKATHKLRLGGYVDPATGKTNVNSLKSKYSNMVFSPVYTFAAKDALNLGIDLSVKGKAVVFVSDDTLLDPSNLIYYYISQKSNLNDNTPKVRMLVLDNYGMSFSQLYDTSFLEKFTNDTKQLPFRANYHGISMYVSLWNWRAALMQFQEAYNKWKDTNNYTDDKINAILEASLKQYKGEDIADYLTKHSITQEDLDKLNNFNNVICKDIPIFRLGQSEDSNDFYVRQFNVNTPTYRGKTKVNLLAINPTKANKFAKILDEIFFAIEPSHNPTSIGVQLMHPRQRKADGTYTDPVPFDKKELIDIDNAEHQRSLSGLFAGKSLAIEDKNGNEMLYKEGQAWSAIPKLLFRFANKVTYAQANYKDIDINGSGGKVSFKLNKDTPTERRIQLDFSTLFNDNIISTDPSDKIVWQLFNLAFHGTVEDVHSSSSQKLTDARFTKGFFINPDISYNVDKSKDIGINYNGETYFYPIATNEGLFTSNNVIQSTSIGIKLHDLINGVKPSTPTSAPINPVESKVEYPNRDILKDVIGLGYDEDDLQQQVETGNTIINSGLINLATTGRLKLDTILKYEYVSDDADINIATLQDIIKQETGTDNYDQITVVNEDGKSTIKIDINGESYKLEGSNLTKFSVSQSNDELMNIKNAVDAVEKIVSNEDNSEKFEDAVYLDIPENMTLEVLLQNYVEAVKEALNKSTEEEILKALKFTEGDDEQVLECYRLISDKIQDIDMDVYNKLFKC